MKFDNVIVLALPTINVWQNFKFRLKGKGRTFPVCMGQSHLKTVILTHGGGCIFQAHSRKKFELNFPFISQNLMDCCRDDPKKTLYTYLYSGDIGA